MVLLKNKLLLLSFLTFLCSCQLGYIAENAYYQADVLRRRVPIDYALTHFQLTEDERRKLLMAKEVRTFMKEQLGLETETNYSRYVQLDQDYVTYVVNAAAKDELKSYTWSFPIVGTVPYKGYFKKESAIEEEKRLQEQNLDTHLRGVAAFSTLGWFEDPILSSMLKYNDEYFVSTLIHETVHANLYINGKSKFNEKVATFLGQLGAEAFYKTKNQGDDFRKKMQDKAKDTLLFSQFITQENKKLKQWYLDHKNDKGLLQKRDKKFAKIKETFEKEVLVKMNSKTYTWFLHRKLNNALLLLLGLYNSDFADLEKLATMNDRDFKKTFKRLKALEDVEEPEKALKALIIPSSQS